MEEMSSYTARAPHLQAWARWESSLAQWEMRAISCAERASPASLELASHGAGRQMSRRVALSSISKSARDEYLKKNDVTLLGGGMDESPQAYKPIESIIKAQTELVDVLGKFTPRIVRMADEPGDS